MLKWRAVVAAVAGLALCAGAPAAAEFYDNFDDGDYHDPGAWDIDNPGWDIEKIVGDTFVADANSRELRLFADSSILPYAFISATVANVSANQFYDSDDHYIVGRTRFFDPNVGEVVLMTHTDVLHWWAIGVGYSSNNWSYIFSADGVDFNNGDTEYRTDLDMANGFWMALQFDVDDPNYGAGDPNGKYIRAALWNGNKYDWDGQWDLVSPAGYDYIERGLYVPYGPSMIATYGTELPGGTHLPADSKFDMIEARIGTFTNVSHTLDLTVKNAQMGTVWIDPDLLDDPNHASSDPNVPTDPNEQRRYTDGTEIVLAAEPVAGKSFKQWKIFDPNHPGDSGYAVVDTNSTLYMTMSADWEIEASFKCGSSEALMPLGMVLLALTIGVALRRPS